jgi:hypothetical protein
MFNPSPLKNKKSRDVNLSFPHSNVVPGGCDLSNFVGDFQKIRMLKIARNKNLICLY